MSVKEGEVSLGVLIDNRSIELSIMEIEDVVKRYPKIKSYVISNINNCMEFHLSSLFDNSGYHFQAVVSKDIYDLIELVYDIKLVNITVDDSKHREFVEVANE